MESSVKVRLLSPSEQESFSKPIWHAVVLLELFWSDHKPFYLCIKPRKNASSDPIKAVWWKCGISKLDIVYKFIEIFEFTVSLDLVDHLLLHTKFEARAHGRAAA